MTGQLFGALTASTKPGLVKANTLTAVAGCFFAGTTFSSMKLVGVTLGTTLLVAAGCSLNNYFDRHLDASMQRTNARPTANGTLSSPQILLFSSGLFILGVLCLALLTTLLCVIIGITAFIAYAFIYTYLKRITPLAVPFGTLPGAAGLVTGYVAGENLVTMDIFLLFLIMFFWQIAHFYAIGLRRKNDYRSAGIPTPAISYKKSTVTKSIKLSIALYTLCMVLLFMSFALGLVFAIISAIMGLWWYHATQKPQSNTEEWAKGVFLRSLLILPISCGLFIASGLIRILS